MQITLKLDENSRRPVVKLDWFYGCRALLDTGALFPVWTGNAVLLEKLGAKLVQEEEVGYGGFGGKSFWKTLPREFLVRGAFVCRNANCSNSNGEFELPYYFAGHNV